MAGKRIISLTIDIDGNAREEVDSLADSLHEMDVIDARHAAETLKSLTGALDISDAVAQIRRMRNAFDELDQSIKQVKSGSRDAFAVTTNAQVKQVTAQVRNVQSSSVNNAFDGKTLRQFNSQQQFAGNFLSKQSSPNFGGQSRQMGGDIALGLGNGLNAGSGGVLQTARNLASKLIANVKSVLGIRSPSTVFFGIGRDIIEGLSGGLRTGGIALTGLITTPLLALSALGISFNAAKEQALTSFGVILRDTEKAKTLFGELQKFAADTPFELPELTQSTKSLLAFGIEQEKILPTLRTLGDLASGVGVPLNELSEIYGKAKTQGRLFAEDINQLTGRGIPIIAELAKQFGVSESEVKKLVEAGKVGFPQLEKAFQDLTSNGGQFAGMMEAQSKTFTGRLSSLKDAVNTAFGDLTEPLFNLIRDAIPTIIRGIEIVSNAFKSLSPATQLVVTAVAAIAVAIGPVIAIIGFLTPTILSLIGVFSTVGGAIVGIGGTISTLATLITLAGGVVPLLGAAFTAFVVPALAAAASAIVGFVAVAGGVIAVVAGIAAVAAGLYLAWTTNFGGIRDFTLSAFAVIQTGAITFLNFLDTQIGAGITNILSFAANNYKSVSDTIKTVSETIKSTINGALSFATAFWQRHGEQITDVVGSAYNLIKTYVYGGFEQIKNAFTLIAQLVNGDYAGAWETAQQIVYQAWKNTTQIVLGAIDLIGKYLVYLGSVLANEGATAFGFLVKTTALAFAQVVSFFVTLPFQIVKNAPQIAAAAVQIGKSIISGIKDGIVETSARNVIGDVITGGLADSAKNAPKLTDYFAKLTGGAKNIVPDVTGVIDLLNKSLTNTGTSGKTAADGLALTKEQSTKLKDLIKDLGFQIQFFGQESQVAATKQQLLKDGITNLNDPLAKQALSLAAQIDGLKNLEKAQKSQIELYGIQSQASEAFYSRQIADVERAIQRQTVTAQAGYAELTALTTANFNKILELTRAKNAATLQDDRLTSDERRNLTAQFVVEQVKSTEDYRRRLLEIDDNYYEKTQENLQQNYEFSKNRLDAIKNTYSGLDSFFNPQNFNAKTAGNLKDGLFGKDFEAGKKKLDSQIKSAMDLQTLYQDLASSYRDVILTNTGTLSSSDSSKQFAFNESLINDVKNQSAEVLRLQTQLEKAFPTKFFELDSLAQNLSSANASIDDFDKASRKLLDIRQIFERSSLVAEKNFILAQKELAQKSGQSTSQFDQQLSIVGNREQQLQIEQTAASVDLYNNSLEGLRETLKSLQNGEAAGFLGVDYEFEQGLLKDQIGLLKEARTLELERANIGRGAEIAARQQLLDISRADLEAQKQLAKEQVIFADKSVFHQDQANLKILQHINGTQSLTEAYANARITIIDGLYSQIDKGLDRITSKFGVFGDAVKGVLSSIIKQFANRVLLRLFGLDGGGGGAGGQAVQTAQNANASGGGGIGGLLRGLLGGGSSGGLGSIIGFNGQRVNVGNNSAGQSANAGGTFAQILSNTGATRQRIAGGGANVPFDFKNLIKNIPSLQNANGQISGSGLGIFNLDGTSATKTPGRFSLGNLNTSLFGEKGFGANSGTIGGLASLGAIAGSLIGGTAGSFVSNISSGALLGLQLGGPIGAGIGAAAGAILSLFGLGKNKKLDKKENIPALQKGFGESLAQMRAIVEQVKAVKLTEAASFNESDVVKQAAEIRAQIASGFGIEFKSKKYKKQAQSQIGMKLQEFDALNVELQAAIAIAREKKSRAAEASEFSNQFVATFAAGSYLSSDFIRRNGKMRGGTPGVDSIPALVMAGEMVVNQMQQERIRRAAGFDVFAVANLPNYQSTQPAAIKPMAIGGFVGNSANNSNNSNNGGNGGNSPVVNVHATLMVSLGVNAETSVEIVKMAAETADGQKAIVGSVTTEIKDNGAQSGVVRATNQANNR